MTREPTPGAGRVYPSATRDPDPEDEGALIERVRRGDTAAFDALVRRHLRRAYAVAYRLLGHREDAEDLVQEAFMTALDHIDRFEPGRPFGPWFFRVLTNRALNFRKARAVRRTEPAQDAADDGRSSPYLDAVRAEVRDRFGAALAALPERQRLIVQLVDVNGMQAAEVASMLELSAGTVRWYLHEARATLRTALASLRGGGGE
jgi:RNA polymerase sigma-70 factor (ECF subfamily)